jgi:polyphosphate kinase
VRSIVDRFLEHSRVYYFENACRPEVFISSADWMPRNFFRRIELAIPVENGILRERLISEVLAISLADNAKARILRPDGSYQREELPPGAKPTRSQAQFMGLRATDAKGTNKPAGGKQRFPRVELAASPLGPSRPKV